MILLKINRSFRTIFLITLSIFTLSKCISDERDTQRKKVSYNDYSGSETCRNCHSRIYEYHVNTGHYLSSQPASDENILGSFEPGRNGFLINALEKVAMEKRTEGNFQVQYVLEKEKQKSKFDITVGSGKKGQSFLSWKYSSLIQMPITYFTPANTWSTSPGFNPRKIAFNRVVTSRCLECHSTYFQKTSDKDKHPEEFDKKNIVYGVDCEKCHGPGKEHVAFHVSNPGIREAKFIVNPGKLPRQRKLDLCALCHNGKLTKTAPSFSFQAGDSLLDFFEYSNIPLQGFEIDVHGNQLGMLSESKCYITSNMTCQSCHNVHENEVGKTLLFSQR